MAKARKKPARQFGNVVHRGKPLRIAVGLQERYVASIMRLVEKMQKEVRAEITALFKKDFVQEHFATDEAEIVGIGMDAASVASQTRILVNSFQRRYAQLFAQAAPDISNDMADSVNRSSFTTTLGSVKDFPNLKEQSKTLSIDMRKLDKPTLQILKTSSAQSAHFIKTIPQRYLSAVGDKVYSSIATGNGMQDLTEFFEKHDTGTKNWVHNTAMDQTRKAYNGLNLGRMGKLGITKGEWIHSGGSQHPRELHEEFDGKTFDLAEGAPVGDDGGNLVQPGEEPNCRCTFGPVLTDDAGGKDGESDEEGEDKDE